MFGRKPKNQNLYYLLPGMTRANREKRKVIFMWSIVIGLFVAGLMAAIVWVVNRPPQL
jgi:glycerol uptake facilitator-like aquaporin